MVLTYVLPAGRFDRRDDPVTGRTVVVPGSYHRVLASPVGPFQALVAIPRGLDAGASVIFLVFIAGGAFSVVDRAGALRAGVEWLADRLQDRERLIVPISCLLFGLGGVVEGMYEEIIALVPVLLILTRRVGFDALTALGMSVGAAGVGSGFSPINPFGVGIAQTFAELPLMSGWQFRAGRAGAGDDHLDVGHAAPCPPHARGTRPAPRRRPSLDRGPSRDLARGNRRGLRRADRRGRAAPPTRFSTGAAP